MKRVWLVTIAAAGVLAAAIVAAPSFGAHPLRAAVPSVALCNSGYTDGVIGGEHKCLHAGEFCSAAAEADYERYGFACVNGHLQSRTPAPVPTTPVVTTTPATPATTPAPNIGTTVPLRRQTKRSGCKLGAVPDRRCSPGAYYSGLTQQVICAATFRTSSIRDVSESERHAVEAEYGLTPKSYGRTLEIDHIVSLELGGSNDIANLFPEKATLPRHQPGFRVKDKLENAVHAAVCSGEMSLHSAQVQIASNWLRLYKKVFDTAPTG